MGAFFFYKYLIEINVKRLVAFLTALMYATSIHLNGYRKSHIMVIIVVVWLPVVLFFIQKYLNSNRKRYLLYSAFALALSFFAGFPQDQLYIDIIVFLYLSIFLIKSRGVKYAFGNVLLWGFSFCGLIMAQLLPTFQLLRYYSSSGANGMSYEEFSNFSISPIKLLMILFPNMFHDNIHQALGVRNSSENDIEIYVGVVVLVVVLYGVIKFFKNPYVRFAFFSIVISFAYASCAHYPVLGKLVYSLPLFGSFRCPSRSLFVFVFFVMVVFAISVQSVLENEQVASFRRFTGVIGIILMSSFVGISIALKCVSWNNGDLEVIVSWIRKDCLIDIIQLICVWLIGNVVSRKPISWLLPVACMGLYSCSVLPYSLASAATSSQRIFEQDNQVYYEKIAGDIGTGKVMVANTMIDGTYDSLFSVEKGIHYNIPTLNAYISINNPKLYCILSPSGRVGAKQNFSGLFTGFENAERDLIYNNDLISMLGVKYIVDPEGLIQPEDNAVEEFAVGRRLFTEQNININNEADNLYVSQYPIAIQSDNVYMCNLVCENRGDHDIELILDFYGGEEYDDNNQQRKWKLSPGQNEFYAYIASGDVPEKDVYIRLITTDECDLTISELELYDVVLNTRSIYVPYIQDDDVTIWENLNAQEVIYSTDTVEQVHSFDNIYANIEGYDFINTSYIEDEVKGELSHTMVKNIVWKNNSAEADVDCEGELGFVNFSNNYYPGWRVYVDGERANLYEVNGIIQGAYISGGQHHIKFVYVPVIWYVSVVISMLTLITDMIVIIVSGKNEKRRNANSVKEG